MCTVSYIPTPSGYIVTTNRDEDPNRETLLPRTRKLANGQIITAPFDAWKGGTWVATDHAGRSACLLNGALKNHKREPPYRISRGQLVVQAFEADTFDDFLETADPDGVEPFTLILFEPGRLQRWVWDGRHSHHFTPDPHKIHLWSSATLYTREEHAAKEGYFRKALDERGSDREALLAIHGRESRTPFILDREAVRTVSITQLFLDGNSMDITYYKFGENETARITMPVDQHALGNGPANPA